MIHERLLRRNFVVLCKGDDKKMCSSWTGIDKIVNWESIDLWIREISLTSIYFEMKLVVFKIVFPFEEQ